MRKLIHGLFFSMFLTLFVPMASAAPIGLELVPSETTITLGDSMLVDLNIFGLGVGIPPTLGAFMIDILFDPSVLSLNNVVFGNLLGTLDVEALASYYDDLLPGVVMLDETSFLFDVELDALQPDTFTLATLEFNGTGLGLSVLDTGLIDLSDATGVTLSPDVTLQGTIVEVTGVPEPGTLILLLVGLAGLVILPKCN